MTEKNTDFGFQYVPLSKKQVKVNEVFNSVAQHYDLMNDLMSFGLHRIWKRQAIMLARISSNHTVLDLAAGTGDLTQLILKKKASVVCADINYTMLTLARDKLIDAGLVQGAHLATLDAQSLPFAPGTFDRIIIGFGLRNVPDKEKALKEMFRTLKDHGILIILEFSHLQEPMLAKLYDHYSFKVLPWLGRKVAKDSTSYQYLAESIRKHPDQEHLKTALMAAGFNKCDYHNILFGVVAIHCAYKSTL
ncbi:MAG TPA: bifunctional demethylmenaquinone methyltransferase/2-methoxy-6-polyprenyl-1,4-benzoquinol methylase UbiE [Gammaproteobacteria bacterium]|nr:bifunctional demethylmenaquinone methyltransferase/2-methoxy-6-polyprenyl-1,4-benzoquinol methylase UbiE [Gammaproteobacteria bacterium]